jgi:hypothetical protein
MGSGRTTWPLVESLICTVRQSCQLRRIPTTLYRLEFVEWSWPFGASRDAPPFKRSHSLTGCAAGRPGLTKTGMVASYISTRGGRQPARRRSGRDSEFITRMGFNNHESSAVNLAALNLELFQRG